MSKKWRLFSLAVLGLTIAVVLFFLKQNSQKQLVKFNPETKKKTSEAKVASDQSEENQTYLLDCQQIFENSQSVESKNNFQLLIVGDVMLARTVNFKTLQSGHPGWPFEKITDLLRSADLTLANLESPFFDNCPITNDGMRFCANTKLASGLKTSGINIVNLANNHAGDYGQEAIDQTKKLLQQEEIIFTGSKETALFNIKGRRIGFLGYNDIFPQTAGINWANKSEIESQISQAKQNNDLVIVSFHWGEEYTFTPTTRQKQLAHLAIDSGADLIIGHHPHWIQPIEIYKNKLIFYSLGNFVFDQMWSQETREGLTALIIFERNNLARIQLQPILIENFGQPKLLSGETREVIINKLKLSCLTN